MKPLGGIIERNIKLVGGDALSQKGFTQVPNAVLKNGTISPGAKLTYALLLSYAWHDDFCFPGQERLADDMGIARQTANRHIQELRKAGFIKVKKQGFNKPNLYEVNLKAKVLGSKDTTV